MLVFRAREEMALSEVIGNMMQSATVEKKIEHVEEYKFIRFPFLKPTKKGDEDMKEAIERVFAGGQYEINPQKVDKTQAMKAKLRERARRR